MEEQDCHYTVIVNRSQGSWSQTAAQIHRLSCDTLDLTANGKHNAYPFARQRTGGNKPDSAVDTVITASFPNTSGMLVSVQPLPIQLLLSTTLVPQTPWRLLDTPSPLPLHVTPARQRLQEFPVRLRPEAPPPGPGTPRAAASIRQASWNTPSHP